MQDSKKARGSRKPTIYITDADYDVIANLALRIEAREPELSAMILEEIGRAKIRAPDRMPPDVVRIGSEVTFVDGRSGTTRKVRLVLPGEADIENGAISVLTPVGAGLIGMSVGGQINWPLPDGRERTLGILEVDQAS